MDSAARPVGSSERPKEEDEFLPEKEYQNHEAQSHLLSLPSVHNSLSLINRLPDELLVKIMMHLVHDAEFSSNWIQITHTSRRFRALGLDCPTLWIRIVHDFCPGLGRTQAFLDRSKQLPVSFRYHGIFGEPPFCVMQTEVIKQIAAHAARISDIWLSGSIDHLPGNLELFTLHFPILQSLSLSSTVYFFAPVTCQREFLPSLQKLALTGIRIDSESTMFKDIRVLELEYIQAGLFLPILMHNPLLEELKLTGTFPMRSANTPANEMVDLPRLRTLVLKTHSDQLFFPNTLFHFIIPQSTFVSITYHGTEFMIMGFLLSIFPLSLDNLGFLHPVRSVSFTRERVPESTFGNPKISYCLQTFIGRDLEESEGDEMNSTIQWTLPMVFDDDPEFIEQMFQDIGQLFSLSRVTTFKVAGEFEKIGSKAWSDRFSDFPHLVNLVVDGQDISLGEERIGGAL